MVQKVHPEMTRRNEWLSGGRGEEDPAGPDRSVPLASASIAMNGVAMEGYDTLNNWISKPFKLLLERPLIKRWTTMLSEADTPFPYSLSEDEPGYGWHEEKSVTNADKTEAEGRPLRWFQRRMEQAAPEVSTGDWEGGVLTDGVIGYDTAYVPPNFFNGWGLGNPARWVFSYPVAGVFAYHTMGELPHTRPDADRLLNEWQQRGTDQVPQRTAEGGPADSDYLKYLYGGYFK